jgi:hypothetical protein
MKRWSQIKKGFLFSAVAMGVVLSGQAAGEEDRSGGRPFLSSFRSPPSDSGLSVSPRTDLSEDEFYAKRGRSAYSKKRRRPKRGKEKFSEREEMPFGLERIISVESAGNEAEAVFPTTALEGWQQRLVTPSDEEEGVERKRQSSFYYHSSLSTTVSSPDKGTIKIWKGPVVRLMGKKSYQVLLCAHFEGPQEKEEVTYSPAPVSVAQHVIVLKRYADDLFPALGDLFQGLRITELDLSYCQMTSAHLGEISSSFHYLQALNLSHNGLNTVPIAFHQWLHRHGAKSLREVDLGHNPWEVEALKNIRLALKRSPVHTLRLRAVGLQGGWNELQGFLMGEAFPGLHFLDLRENKMNLTVSSVLEPVLRRDTFLLLSDSLHVEVRPKKPRRPAPAFAITDEERTFYSTPFFHAAHTKGRIDTVQMSASLLFPEDHLMRKLKPRGVRHVELEGGIYQPTKIMPIFALEDLTTLNVGRLDLTLSLARQIAHAMKSHHRLFKLDLSEQDDLGWNIVQELVEGLRPVDLVLSAQHRRMVKQYGKQLAQWEQQPPVNRPQRRQMEKAQEKIAQLTETRPFTLVLPTHLSRYEGALQELLQGENAARLTIEFPDDGL